MGSVVKKRRKKITKHKHRKLKKKMRHKNKERLISAFQIKKEGSSRSELPSFMRFWPGISVFQARFKIR